MEDKIALKQVLHKEDGGAILLVNSKDGLKFICKICKTIWELPLNFKLGMRDDFIEYEEDK